jgi:transposase
MDYQRTLFVGVDTHKNHHTAVAINAFHQPVALVETPNNPRKYPAFLKAIMAEISEGMNLVFGLEDTQGLGRSLAQWLIQQGFVVKEVNPVYTDRERKRRTDPDKSDPKDAKAIADILYRDFNRLPSITTDGSVKALKNAVTAREQLVRQATMVKNQLHAYLHQQYPDYQTFFSDPFCKTGLAFFSKFPSPAHLQRYGVSRLLKFLKKQANNMSVYKAQWILEHIDKEMIPDLSTDVLDTIIPTLISQLQMLQKHQEVIETKITELLNDSEFKLRTMKGIGDILAATIQAEIGNIDRFDSPDKLARYAGIAPADQSSGNSSRKKHRKYGRRRLNFAFYLLALNQIGSDRSGQHRNPVAFGYYHKKLGEGKSPKTALRCLMRRLVDIVFAMMRDRSAYSFPERALPEIKKVI